MASNWSKALLTHTKKWVLVDAKYQPVGRLAVQIATALQGKNKPIYHPSTVCGDHVVVINTQQVAFTGRKWKQKLYRHHTGFPRGFREQVAEKVHDRDPTLVLRKAINGMLPKNNLRKRMMRQLYLFAEDEHPYLENIAEVLEPPTERGPPLPSMMHGFDLEWPNEGVPEGFEIVSEELLTPGNEAALSNYFDSSSQFELPQEIFEEIQREGFPRPQ